ncbi:MAG TPA: 4Fe-4S ferredoxin [Archaeoglobaceae archaeon]|nr:4Fe-4S ferredoxin [Archaeoglobaceae archaeon]
MKFSRKKRKSTKSKKSKRKIVIDRYKCAYCGACISVCKFNANELVETYLEINEEECNACLACVRTCPVNALIVQEVSR